MNTALWLNAVTFSYPLPTFLHLSGICDIEDTLTFNEQSLREVDRERIGLWGTNYERETRLMFGGRTMLLC
jgi:hypothetical protein